MSSLTTPGTIGVVLMSYGPPETSKNVRAFLANVRTSYAPAEDLAAEFQRRYEILGGSPLLRFTLAQESVLEALLNTRVQHGESYVVTARMCHTPPWITDAFTQLASHRVRRAVAVILSPQ